LYDIAGNVREWGFNAVDEAGSQRCILGGAWTDPGYMFVCGEVASPWDRSERNGFRCMRSIDAVPESALEPYDLRVRRDIADVAGHTDEEFRSYKNFFSYDRTEIEARIESVDDESSNLRIESVSFDAVYGGERVIVHIIVPKNSKGPYQPVVYFPPGGSRNAGAKVNMEGMHGFEFIPHSGRAFIWPIYKGTYDRAFDEGYPDAPLGPNAHRDWCAQMYQDLARTIDYLESRDDMALDKLTYLGMSWGAMVAPRYLALEDRINYGILVAGSCWVWHDADHPAVDSAKFLPHVKVPVLMLNGEYDVIFPYDTSQEPTFRLLGTPAADKEHKTYPYGHTIVGLVREELKRDILEWLDKYPGPVDAK
jgi:dienelactone hydrolase